MTENNVNAVFITENTEIKVNNRAVSVKNMVGRGASADVYIGEFLDGDKEKVAIKASRPSSALGYKAEFRAEANHLELIANKLVARNPAFDHVLPIYYGGDIESDAPYLVEEFITGIPLDEALGELPEKAFSETAGFYLASIIGTLLQTLHEDLNKCYSDIKFDNFRIINGSYTTSKPELLVMDWNLLLPITSRNIMKDLFFSTYYLMFMLTGRKDVTVDKDNLLIKNDLNSMPEFKTLSIFAQEFIQTNLHPFLGSRAQTAKEWLRGIDDILQYAQKSGEDLAKDASSMVRRAERFLAIDDKEAVEKYLIAKKLANLAEIKGFAPAAEIYGQIHSEISAEKFMGRIDELLDQTPPNATDALDVCQAARKSVLFSHELGLLLTEYALSAIITTNNSETIDSIRRGTKLRIEGDYSQSLTEFKKAQLDLEPFSLGILINECESQLTRQKLANFNSTDQESIDQYTRELIELDQKISSLPDVIQFVCFEADGYNSKRELEQNTKNKHQIAEYLGKIDSATDETLGNIVAEALNNVFFSSAIKSRLLIIIEQKKNHGLHDLAETLANNCKDIPDFMEARNQIRLQKRLTEEYNKYGAGTKLAYEAIQDFLSSNPTIRKENEHLQILFRDNLLNTPDLIQAIVLRDAMVSKSGGEDFFNLSKTFSDKLKNQLKNIDFSNPEKITDKRLGEFEKIIQKLQEADLVDNETSTIIQKTEKLQRDRRDMLEKNQETVEKIDKEIVGIQTLIEQIRQLEKQNISEEIKTQLSNEKRKQIRLLVEWIGKRIEKDSQTDISGYLEDLKKDGDLSTRIEQYKNIRKLIESDINEIKETANKAMSAGNIEEARLLIKLLRENQLEVKSLAEKLQTIEEFIKWSNNVDLLEADWSDWESRNIPELYWSRSSSVTGVSPKQYVDNKIQQTLVDFTLNSQKLKKLIVWRRHSRRIISKVDSQASSTWNDVLQAALEYESVKPNEKEEKRNNLLRVIDNYNGEIKTVTPASPKADKDEGTYLYYILAVLIVVAVLLFGYIIMKTKQIGPWTPTPTQESRATSTRAPRPTADLSATQTQEAADFLAQTEEATTPVPTSVFLWKPEANITTNGIANNASPMFLLDNDSQSINASDPWKISPHGQDGQKTIGADMKYVGQNTKAIFVWKLDVGIPEDGIYEIYVSDTNTQSGFKDRIEYQILSNDGTVKPLIAGTNKISQSANGKQTDLKWSSVGYYKFLKDESVSISVEVKNNTLKKDEFFGADAVIIAKVDDPTLIGLDMELSTTEHIFGPPVMWANTGFEKPVNQGWSPNGDGVGESISFEANKTPELSWKPANLLPGTYKLWMKVPAEMKVAGGLNIITTLVNGTEKLLVKTLTKDELDANKNKFIEIGEITISESQPIEIKLTATDMQSGDIFAYSWLIITNK